jgi:SSS family solute:Na+ symporter
LSVGAVDLAILLVYMAGVVFLGTWVGRATHTAADFMVGGRDLPWWVILFSIVATETSTVTFLSIPGFAFGRDMTWLQIVIGFVVGRFLVAFLLLPQYFSGNFYTAYEVLERRFGGATKQTASVMFIITRSLADGLRLFLSAIVLQEMTGIPMHWAVVTIGSATIVYTYLGGMRAVLWTDFLQFLVYMGGAALAFWLLLERLPGGWQQMMSGGAFITLGSHGVDQMMVQRYLSARNLPDARRALIASGFVVLAQFAVFLLIGVGLYCFYQLVPPEAAFERDDRVFARFILDHMPVGVLGVLLGAIFAAAMSTLSSSLNSCATAAANDLYFPLLGRDSSGESKLRVIRILTACFGLVQIVVGIAGQWLQSTVVAGVLGIAAFTTGIVLGVFFLGTFTERVGQRAALFGLVVGLVGMLIVFFATPLAWPWFALVGSLGTFSVGLVASYIWPRRKLLVDQ